MDTDKHRFYGEQAKKTAEYAEMGRETTDPESFRGRLTQMDTDVGQKKENQDFMR